MRVFKPAYFVLLFALSLTTGAFGRQTPTVTPQEASANRKVSDTGVEDLRPLWQAFAGKSVPCQITLALNATLDGRAQEIEASLYRIAEDAFRLEVRHPEYAAVLVRNSNETRLILPKHRVIYAGTGKVDPVDHLDPRGIVRRLLGKDSQLSLVIPLILETDPALLTTFTKGFVDLTYLADEKEWRIGDSFRVHCTTPGSMWLIKGKGVEGSLKLETGDALVSKSDHGSEEQHAETDSKSWRTITLPREELELNLSRGFRRSCEVLLPGPALISPAEVEKSVDHGMLRWKDGHRVATLWGTPTQIGKAHAEILAPEAKRCLDSVLYAFGTLHTISTGRWFRQDLEDAYHRLAPYIPADHTAELHALADALGYDRKVMEALGVFPELFHCSGFALFGKATVDGKLYHGRVLDYMTEIGLQDAATTFAVAVDGKIPFVNVGYAGFVGSVSGMNAQGISLGEMGGKGEGKWDGVPMTTLMRRGLEECSTLDEVMDLWRKNPRTCEYYYVFADGKSRRAVGVAATPDELTFIQPGQSDPRLGEGIEDAVVLSAGDRLLKLRQRVQEKYGQVDVEIGQWLMSRPVAMKSNLHNVLFVPEDGILYVANASHKQPACERPYVRLDLRELLSVVPPSREQATNHPFPFGLEETEFSSHDSLHSVRESSTDALQCLQNLVWTPAEFKVQCEIPGSNDKSGCDLFVRFPSPVTSGDAINDRVALEWYFARESSANKNPVVAPAIIVVHESGKAMPVGRLFAQGLRSLGFHTFMIQLPQYGVRRGQELPKNIETLVTLMRQGIADIRRARDAVAVLPWVDNRNVSLQGTSLGGFAAAVAGALDEGFAGVFLMLAGGDLESIIEHGARDTARLRESAAQAGIDATTLHDLTQVIEPNRVAHRLPKKRTWLFSGLWDDVVPYANALALAKNAGLDDDHHVKMMADHYSGVLLLPMVFKRIRDGLNDISMSAPESIQSLPRETEQVILVRQSVPGSSRGQVSTWERTEQDWRLRESGIPCNLGREGIAHDGEKREGDGKTPSGSFRIGMAFGRMPEASTHLAYRAMTPDDIWIDDPASPQYNHLTTLPTTATSYETMQLKSGAYDLGAVIEYNTDPVIPGAGSAIFLHGCEGPPEATAGCVSFSRDALADLLEWLDHDRSPHIVIERCGE